MDDLPFFVGPMAYTVMLMVIIVIVGYGSLRVANGDMSTGTLIAFILYIFIINEPVLNFFQPLVTLVQYLMKLQQVLINIQRKMYKKH